MRVCWSRILSEFWKRATTNLCGSKVTVSSKTCKTWLLTEFAVAITAALTAEKERVAREERARLELQRARQAVVDARQSMCQHRWVVETWHESTDTGESCTAKYCPVCGKHA